MKPAVALCFAVSLLLAGCSRSNNLLLGRVEATVGTHTVAVTDCYRLRVPAPEIVQGGQPAAATYRFMPCRDAEVVIRAGQLEVNGLAYGHLNPRDEVLVDHGMVSVKRRGLAK